MSNNEYLPDGCDEEWEFMSRFSLADAPECCICGFRIEVQANGWAEGHSPSPILEHGRCCGVCNDTIVIPARMDILFSALNGGDDG